MLTVRELIEILETYDGNMRVKIGMKQKYGSDFAMDINYDVEKHTIRAFFGEDYKAVVITEGCQCGTVDYDDDYGNDDWD